MSLDTVYWALFAFVAFMSAVTFWGSLRKANRYGRYMREGQRHTVPALVGWMLFESPQVLAFALTFLAVARDPSPVAWGLFAVWQAHYVHRAILYPLRMRDRHKRFPVGGVVAGLVFNSINGFLNGVAVATAAHLDATWLTDPRFVAGTAVFAAGWVVNFHSDSVLISLRSDGFTGYRIPEGGLFRWVSCANYTGEIVMWCGWALLTWTSAGALFAVFTLSNLGPRALSHHRWYLKTFPDYPSSRKALVPGLL